MKQSTTVLIIDDDIITLRIQDKILTRMGYQVFTCITALNIFETIEKYAPDIIIMDHAMPFITGLEAIKQIRSNMLSSPIPIIFFSIYEDVAEEAIKAGATAYVPKGSTTDFLTNAINSLINKTVE